ncbi:cytochrome P450 [Coprinopsis marcescibilis]|uniref:Cytochrome P450 n=1 Tax=Coprinopsis marcescibilis TaxID=230819 RepID=A0A5C3L8T6_COPMA|nr:cytochrome P450 [Coprinopsis marcescibilis]
MNFSYIPVSCLQSTGSTCTVPAKSALTVLAITWTVWKLLKKLTIKNPLRNIPGPKSNSYLAGNISDVFNFESWSYHDALARDYPGVANIPSVAGSSLLHITDPKAMHSILLKDQHSFDTPEDTFLINNLVFGPGVLSTSGDRHRRQRKLLNPVFSVAHMREMVPIFYNVSHKLRDSIRKEVMAGKSEIDALSWMTRTALELIGQSGLGYSFDSLEPGSEPHPFYKAMKNFITSLQGFWFSRLFILPYTANVGTPRLRRFVVDLLPWKKLHYIRDLIDVMHNTSLEIYTAKKRALEQGDEALAEQIGMGKDIMSILLKSNLSASGEGKMPEDEIIGQMSTLTFAAMDTTSNALSRILHVLSENQDAQVMLREEILQAQEEHGELPYDILHQLPYLDAICRETLRLFPPVPYSLRQAKEDTVVPLARPFTAVDGKEMCEIFVPKGTTTFLSILACNRDPLVWGPDAAEWKPERWLSPLPDSVINARVPGVYSHLMTFLGGGRACIGFKFSQLEMKVVLCDLLEAFKFESSDKTITWQYNLVVQPTVDELADNGTRKLQLPLKVSLV